MKKFLLIALIIVMAVAVAACQQTPAPAQTGTAGGNNAETTAGGDAERTLEVTLILKDNTSPGWRYLAGGAMRAGREYNINVTENSPLETQDADQQMRAMEDAIERGVDAIVIAPVDSAGIVPAINRANEAGIPVFTSNTRAFVDSPDDVVTFVGVNNEEGAYSIATYMFSQFPEGQPINLIIIDGNRAGQTTLDRIAGFERAMAEDDRVNLLDIQEARFARAQAQEVMETFLVRHDHIDLVMALNDEMAIGAFNAIEAAGRVDEMLISGFDGSPQGLQAVIDGTVTATLNQDLPGQGSEAIRAVRRYFEGETIEDWIRVGGQVALASDAQAFLDVLEQG